MRLEIDIPEHHYNNIIALDSVSLGRVPYKGIIMYTINAIKHGKVLEQEPTTKNDLGVDCISRFEVTEILNSEYDIDKMLDRVDKLPTVTPQEPKLFSIVEIKYDKDKLKELVNKAVLTVAPQEPQIFKWCDTCREYDQEKHCCHRWSKVIRDTVEEMKQEPILDKIREQIKDYLRGVEITLEVLVENDPLRPKMEGAKDTLEECLNLIDKAETEAADDQSGAG